MLQTIILPLITMFVGFLLREVWGNIIKPAWVSSKIDQNKKRALLRWLKYLSMAMLIASIIVFMSLSKFMILLLCLCFSIFTLIFVYDYSLSVLQRMIFEKESEEKQRQKQFIYQELSRNEHNKKFIERLKKLDD